MAHRLSVRALNCLDTVNRVWSLAQRPEGMGFGQFYDEILIPRLSQLSIEELESLERFKKNPDENYAEFLGVVLRTLRGIGPVTSRDIVLKVMEVREGEKARRRQVKVMTLWEQYGKKAQPHV